MNISISHTYIQNLIEQPVNEFEYRDEFVILPQDFKVNKKTSNDRKVTDTAIVHMFKRMDVKISGKLTADEVFLKMMKNRQYLVTIMDKEVQDMPIAVAIMKTRKFETMKSFFDFVAENTEFRSLTSDLLKVYQ
jgi:hypothetical protein